MANAKRCDRCGEYYKYNQEIMVYLVTDPPYDNKKKFLNLSIKQSIGSDIQVDLCPKCTEELMAWWRHIDRDVPKEDGDYHD